MSYIKAKEAKVSEDGLSITITVKDEHSCEQASITLPAEEWGMILSYRNAYRETEARLWEQGRRMVSHWIDSSSREKLKEHP